MASVAIPCISDHVGPAMSRGSPAGSKLSCWHRTMTSSRSPNARSPAMSTDLPTNPANSKELYVIENIANVPPSSYRT